MNRLRIVLGHEHPHSILWSAFRVIAVARTEHLWALRTRTGRWLGSYTIRRGFHCVRNLPLSERQDVNKVFKSWGHKTLSRGDI